MMQIDSTTAVGLFHGWRVMGGVWKGGNGWRVADGSWEGGGW